MVGLPGAGSQIDTRSDRRKWIESDAAAAGVG
jgi:hypothetical protein